MCVWETNLLREAYEAWAAKDLPAVMACFAEDVVFTVHLAPDLPMAGEVRGRAALEPRLQSIMDAFDFLEYTPLQISTRGIIFHSQVKFHYRHKATGLEYDGSMRHNWRIENSLISHFEEFHDSERVRAYFALLAEAERRNRGGSPTL